MDSTAILVSGYYATYFVLSLRYTLSDSVVGFSDSKVSVLYSIDIRACSIITRVREIKFT